MSLEAMGIKRYKSARDFNAALGRDLSAQHASVIADKDKFEVSQGRGPIDSQTLNRNVQKSLEDLVKRKPTIYKTPQTKYP